MNVSGCKWPRTHDRFCYYVFRRMYRPPNDLWPLSFTVKLLRDTNVVSLISLRQHSHTILVSVILVCEYILNLIQFPIRSQCTKYKVIKPISRYFYEFQATFYKLSSFYYFCLTLAKLSDKRTRLFQGSN